VVVLQEFLSRIVKPLVDLWKRSDKLHRIRIYVSVGVVAVAVGTGLYMLTRPTYTTVIDNVDSADIVAMQRVLTVKGVSYKLTDSKSGIVVNVKDSDKAHLALMNAGYPKNGQTFSDAISNIKIDKTESGKIINKVK
jgi:flagellar M-ring protein FliF